ncbi:MAG: YhcH/YjgK/YiaL family protein [Sphaerochaeta sp.]|nr:YhcH/YjgK/YiaL family protein [Sphaerochaeta sp.]
MIYDQLPALSQYNSLIDELPNVLMILESKQWEKGPVGKKICHNPRISYELVEYTSSGKPRLYQVFEEKTMVHILLSGEELMAVSWREHARSLSFDQEGQATLAADPIGVIHAKVGHFALFMPGEPHTVGMESPGKQTKVRKLIFTLME